MSEILNDMAQALLFCWAAIFTIAVGVILPICLICRAWEALTDRLDLAAKKKYRQRLAEMEEQSYRIQREARGSLQ